MSIRTTCPYCGVGCGVLASPDGTIKGDPQHPANLGRLCSKGSALGETIDLKGRLLAPRIAGKDVNWDEALDLVAGQFSAAIRAYGPDSVAFYVSGQLLTEDYYVANKLMKGYIGSANIDTNSRLCMASSVAGHKRAFGADTVPGTYEDLEQADLIVLVGSNLAWCHPVLHQRISAAKAARPHMRVVNIDPRRTASSDLADLHLQIAPDGDAALFNGLLAHLADTGHLDQTYLTEHVTGFDAALASARATNTAATGLTPDELAEFYTLWASTEKTVTIYSQGVNQSGCGTDKVNAIINCHLATGRIGRPGMGPFSVTGQPNAMGGREVGGLANMLANHLDIENPDHRAAVQKAWNSPTICTTPGLKAVDLFEACESGQIKALWIMSTNPAVSLPDADRVARAIAKVPFTVVTDIMARTDTGDLADVLLPAAGWGEKDGTVTNSERRISRQRAFLPVPGQARPDWQIICDVAARMGWVDAFAYGSPAEIFDEYARLSALGPRFGRDLNLTGLAGLGEAGYKSLTPVQWPVPANGQGTERFFAKGGFYHADGKARMLAITPPERDSRDGFRLNTGRIRDQWHTMTRTGKSPRLAAHLAEPFVEIHPKDAAQIGVKPADIVQISATNGGCGLFRALVSPKVRRSEIFAPMHWTRQRSSAAWVNSSVGAVCDPVSGQPALKGARVDVARFDAKWYAFVAADTDLIPGFAYFAASPTTTGARAELAGTTEISEDAETVLRAVTGIAGGTTSQFRDTATGQTRVAISENGILRALLFVSSEPVALARSHAIALIGTETPPLQALTGRPSADMPDPGAIVCSCMSVGINTLRDAIAAGAHDVETLGKTTCAGSNCGSCKPELAALILASKTPLAAE